MGSEYQRSAKGFISSLLLLLALGRWSVVATIPNGTVTECSLSRLTFEFWEERRDDLDFAAACLDINRTCFRGVDVTTQKEPHIGEQVTITLSSCDQNRNLTPTDPGQCILQIVSQDIINSSPCTSVHVCTLPTSTNTVASSPTQTISIYSSTSAHPQNSKLPRLNSTGGQQHPATSPHFDSTVSIVVPLSLLITLLVIAFAVAIAALIVWTRHAQIRAQRVLRIEEVMLDVSPSVLFGTGDGYLPGDNLTLYEDFDAGGDEEDANKTELTLKERLCSVGDDLNSSVTDSNVMASTMQNSPPVSSLGYQYVAIRTES